MSRIGKAPVAIPEKVTLDVQDRVVKAKGPLGELSFRLPPGIELKKGEGSVSLEPRKKDPQTRANWGTARARVKNLVDGVSTGFTRSIQISGLGFRAQVQGDKIQFQLGYSHPITYAVPKGVTVELDQKNNILTFKGADKELVGKAAANARSLRTPEPYKGKGIRFTDEHIIRKAGKAAGAGKK